MSRRMIEPLRDDFVEQASAFRRWWAKRWDGGNSLLRKSLFNQLRLRPDIAYKDLWTDEKERQIAGTTFDVLFPLPPQSTVIS